MDGQQASAVEQQRNFLLLCVQGVASMLMGLHLNTLGEALLPRNPHNGHVWEHPPVIILRTLHDEDSVVERVNRTLIALHNQASRFPCNKRAALMQIPPQGSLCSSYVLGLSGLVADKVMGLCREH